MTLQMKQSQTLDIHGPHDCFWCSFCT